MRRILYVVVLLTIVPFCTVDTFAQYYNVGVNPAGVKWRQIKDGYFTLIYPEEIDSLAQRYLWLLQQAHRPVTSSMRVNLRNIPVILHPYNINSNGIVVWTPRRMELYTTPPPVSYAQAWDKQLVLHETRHVAQMFKLREGLFKFLHLLIGEQSEGAAAGIYACGWYLEGDAVVSETAGSFSGRGRQAEFLMPYKAYYLNNYKFSWDTWHNGSYRYLIPSVYELGYVMSAYAYMKTDPYIFAFMNEYTVTHPLWIAAPARALYKYGGFYNRDLHQQSFAFMDSVWQKEDSEKKLLPERAITAVPRIYESYRTPLPINSQKLLAVRSSMADIPRLVAVDNKGKEQFLRYLGLVNSALSGTKGKVYWTEVVPHTRWEQKSYSIIKRYDEETKKLSVLSRRTRYFSVAAAPHGETMAVVENRPDGENFLMILNAETGVEIQRVAAPVGATLKELAWNDDADLVYASLISDAGMGVQRFNLQQHQWEQVIPESINAIRRPVVSGNHLFFESGYNEVNNIYALDIRSHTLSRLTDARFGAFDPIISDDKRHLIFSDYSDKGYGIKSVSMDSAAWQVVDFSTPHQHVLADVVSKQMNFNIDTLQIPSSISYSSKRYNRLAHLFRVHSWMPVYFNPDIMNNLTYNNLTEKIDLGATILSQNTLGTATTALAYRYRNAYHSGHFGFTYQGWYPVIELKADINDRSQERHDIMNTGTHYYDSAMTTSQPYVNVSTRLYVPFNLTRGAWKTALIPQLAYHFTNDEYSYSYPTQRYTYYQFIRSGATFYSRLPLAARDLYPRWGFVLQVLNTYPLANSNNFNTITSLQLTTYMPGFMKNHSFMLNSGYQWQSKNNLRSAPFSHLRFPYGYIVKAFQQLTMASATYTMPLFYPDWNIGALFYLKRVQMALFSDYGYSKSFSGTTTNMFSSGFDCSIDFHFLRMGAPVNLGVRCIFPEDDKPLVELLFGLKIN